MLYIVGTTHLAQAYEGGMEFTAPQRSLSQCLQTGIVELRPEFIAEEYSQEILDDAVAKSIAKDIATELGLEHKFCDPTQDERSEIGYREYQSIFFRLRILNDQDLTDEELHTRARAIEIARYFPLRENFWLHRLAECSGANGIFVCGDGHIQSFTDLLTANHIEWQVTARRVGFEENEDSHFQEAVEYLRQHPELKEWDGFHVRR